jgi:hypothetical protein
MVTALKICQEAVLSVGLMIDDIIIPLDGQFLCFYIMYIRAASEGRGSLRFSLRSLLPDVQQAETIDKHHVTSNEQIQS